MLDCLRFPPIALLALCCSSILPVCALADGKPAPLAAIEERVLVLVNEHRAAAGLRSLESDARIAKLARRHSVSMAEGKASLGHAGWGERSRATYELVPALGLAENVSRHQGREADEVPNAALESWLGSAVHRKNLEGKRYDLTGVGAALAPDGSYFITQIYVEREGTR